MWPVTSSKVPGPKAAAKYKIGDGGHMDNSGLLPILQRKVPRVVMFVNTDVPISLKWDFCAPKRLGGELATAATWYFVDKFGLAAHIKGQFQMHNQVFHFKDLQPILCDLQTHRQVFYCICFFFYLFPKQELLGFSIHTTTGMDLPGAPEGLRPP